MKEYVGIRVAGEVSVTVNGKTLDPRLDLRSHSPGGFEWGYAGSGPAQLALAILADYLGNAAKALTQYQDFKFTVVARLDRDGWTLTSQEIQRSINALGSRQPGMSTEVRLTEEESS